jgi:hypothetical protein
MFFGAVLDIFVTLRLWYLTDSIRPDIVVDENCRISYNVIDVIKEADGSDTYLFAAINHNEDLEPEEARESIYNMESRMSESVSDRLAAQFIITIVPEGPDRNWEEDYDFSESSELEVESLNYN